MIDLGFPYIPLGWEYFAGFAVCFMINLAHGADDLGYHNQKHRIYWAPLIALIIFYFLIGIAHYLLTI